MKYICFLISIEALMLEQRTISKQTAQKFYDVVGSALDLLAIFEDAPRQRAVNKLNLRDCNVIEFGLGTGRVAEDLIVKNCLSYTGLDISTRMTQLAQERLAKYPSASVICTDATEFKRSKSKFDIVCSFYLIDLLSLEDSRKLLDVAYDCLVDNGIICLVSITSKPPHVGNAVLSSLFMGAWTITNRILPAALGGCRPISLSDIVLSHDRSTSPAWNILHNEIVSVAGYTSEIMIAEAAAKANKKEKKKTNLLLKR